MATASASSIHTDTPARERKIVVAQELGYCWGVRRALDIIEDAATPEKRIAPIGDIIHNPQVVDRLRERGVEGAASVQQWLANLTSSIGPGGFLAVLGALLLLALGTGVASRRRTRRRGGAGTPAASRG